MAHLPRDGKGRSQDAGGATGHPVDLYVAEGASGQQLVIGSPGPLLARQLSCRFAVLNSEEFNKSGHFERWVARPFLAMSAPLSAGALGDQSGSAQRRPCK